MHLRQDQGAFIFVEVIQAGLLGIHRIMEDGQLAQTLHKSIGFRSKNCGLQQQKRVTFQGLFFVGLLIINERGLLVSQQHINTSLTLNPRGKRKKLHC